MPERLGELTVLRSLELQSGVFDGESTTDNLRLSTSLQVGRQPRSASGG